MKIQYCSDLHLEFNENKNFIENNPLIPVGDILILAGDILLFKQMSKGSDFFSYVSDNFKETYWIAGNHEYYNYDITKKPSQYTEKISSNVTLLNNNVIKIDDVNFIFATMWSKISEHKGFAIQQGLNDFHVIKNNGNRLSVSDYNNLHDTDLNFIKDSVEKTKGEKQVVITHHVPTFLNYPEQYKNSPINEAFATELFDFIVDTNINKWIYGHSHANIPSFKIGETEMLTNQLGYVRHNEHNLFKLNACFEI